MYYIVRMYQDRNRRSRVIRRGLTLEQAQAHCADPETSWSTCTTARAKARTRRCGPWFDGYGRADMTTQARIDYVLRQLEILGPLAGDNHPAEELRLLRYLHELIVKLQAEGKS